MDQDQRYHWLVLAHLPDLPAGALRRLIDLSADPGDLLERRDREWLLAGAGRTALRHRRAWSKGSARDPVRRAAEQALSILERERAWLVPLGTAGYPPLLAMIHDPPPLLYVAGEPRALQQSQFAIVGSRQCSSNSARAAQWFAADLVESGFSVCSGMALGIDAAAHRGALDAGGFTLGVLGTGIDVCYPRRHATLRAAILESGALVSEFNPGEPPRREQFPQRNRLISGLSVGVLVAEANLRSGSLITARFALEQNREVFALPHSIFDPGGRGCHQLLKEGAGLAETAADVLGPTASLRRAQREFEAPGQAVVPEQLSFDPLSVDELVAAGLGTVEEVLVMLEQLEQAGCVEQRGGLYCRKVC